MNAAKQKPNRKRKRVKVVDFDKGMQHYPTVKIPRLMEVPPDPKQKVELFSAKVDTISRIIQPHPADEEVKKFLMNVSDEKIRIKLTLDVDKIIKRAVDLDLISVADRKFEITKRGEQMELKGSPGIILAAFLKANGPMALRAKDLHQTKFGEWCKYLRTFAIKSALSNRWISFRNGSYKANRLPLMTEDIRLERILKQSKTRILRRDLIKHGFIETNFEMGITPMGKILQEALKNNPKCALHELWRDAYLEKLLYAHVRPDMIKFILKNGGDANQNTLGRAPWEVLFGVYPVDKSRKDFLQKQSIKQLKHNWPKALGEKKDKIRDFTSCLKTLLRHGLNVNRVHDMGRQKQYSPATTILRMLLNKSVHVMVQLQPKPHPNAVVHHVHLLRNKNPQTNLEVEDAIDLIFKFGADPFTIGFLSDKISKIPVSTIHEHSMKAKTVMIYTLVSLGLELRDLFDNVTDNFPHSRLLEKAFIQRHRVLMDTKKYGQKIKYQLSTIPFIKKISDPVWEIICLFMGPVTFFIEAQNHAQGVPATLLRLDPHEIV